MNRLLFVFCLGFVAANAFEVTVNEEEGITWHVVTPAQVENFFQKHKITTNFDDDNKSGLYVGGVKSVIEEQFNNVFTQLQVNQNSEEDNLDKHAQFKKILSSIFSEQEVSQEEKNWVTNQLIPGLLENGQSQLENNTYDLHDIQILNRELKHIMIASLQTKFEEKRFYQGLYIAIKYDHSNSKITFFGRSLIIETMNQPDILWRSFCNLL